MLENYRNLCSGREVRASLIAIKQKLRSPRAQAEFREVCGGCYDTVMKCLVHEDPKVRKNAAAILGRMKVQEALDVLMDAYLEEETLFVRPDYVEAMAELDCSEYLDDYRSRLQELQTYDAPENEKKHILAEQHALQELLLAKEGIAKHPFCGGHSGSRIILTTIPAFRNVLADAIPFKKTELKAGVRTTLDDLDTLLQIRTWNEMLFVPNAGKLEADPQKIAEGLSRSDLTDILDRNHRSTDQPYYFRVMVISSMDAADRSTFTKNTALAIEQAFAGRLKNSASHYEIELRLIADRNGMYSAYLKLFTIPDHRFDYRREHIAASMRPALAAGLLTLAKPWLKEYAQVLDPFCGTGTLLIERRFAAPVRNSYGIDTFGEAIEKARINTDRAGLQINYINRNYFDFEHDYLFDEIITDMPSGHTDKRQTDELYRQFFEKSLQMLSSGGRIFCYTKEMGLVKKYIRLMPQYRLLHEFSISEKSGTWFFIIGTEE